jgi:hypothetical protein
MGRRIRWKEARFDLCYAYGESSRGIMLSVQDNSIGPSKSDCIGSELVVAADPAKSFEIVSETQTPDIPSGKKWVLN